MSAAHGVGVTELMQTALADFPEEAAPAEARSAEAGTRVAIVGRPNVGKSTLVNTLIGERRLVASDQPGTTRDAIEVEFEFAGSPFILIDTAGIRRKGRVFEAVEKFSVVKTLQAIERDDAQFFLFSGGGNDVAGPELERFLFPSAMAPD